MDPAIVKLMVDPTDRRTTLESAVYFNASTGSGRRGRTIRRRMIIGPG